MKIFSVHYLVVYQKTFLKCLRYFNNFKWTILIVAADENIIEGQLALIFIFGMRLGQCFFYTICVLFLFNVIDFQSQLPVLLKLRKKRDQKRNSYIKMPELIIQTTSISKNTRPALQLYFQQRMTVQLFFFFFFFEIYSVRYVI